MLLLYSLLWVAALADIVPLTLWSGQRYFKGDHAEIDDTISLDDVISALQLSSQASSTLMEHFNSAPSIEKPELLVAFVADELSSAEATRQAGGYSRTHAATGLKDLKLQLTSASSSLQIPFVNTGSSSITKELRSSLASNALSLHTTLGDEGEDRCAKLVQRVQDKPGLFDNGVTDLVLVAYSPEQQAEASTCMNHLMSYVSRSTTEYMALFSANSAPQLRTDFRPEPSTLSTSSLPSRRSMQQNTGNTTLNCELYGYCGPKYVTSTGMFAILLLLFMILVFWCGLSSLLEVTAPPRFAYQSLAHSLAKEM